MPRKSKTPTHKPSVSIPVELWEKAQALMESRGINTFSAYLQQLIKADADGRIKDESRLRAIIAEMITEEQGKKPVTTTRTENEI